MCIVNYLLVARFSDCETSVAATIELVTLVVVRAISAKLSIPAKILIRPTGNLRTTNMAVASMIPPPGTPAVPKEIIGHKIIMMIAWVSEMLPPIEWIV